jgi:predicted metalloendopeptidase
MLRTFQFLWEANVADLLEKNSRDTWPFVPTTANAAYMYSFNSITIPMGVLDEPKYRPNRIKALNYGGVGFTAGHEILHG